MLYFSLVQTSSTMNELAGMKCYSYYNKLLFSLPFHFRIPQISRIYPKYPLKPSHSITYINTWRDIQCLAISGEI